jgi:epsin
LGEHEAHLAQLFANRDDGQDTFGNIGALRYVLLFEVDETLMYAFFSISYGQTDAGRNVLAQQTGATSAASSHNPFAKQPQSTDQPFFNI